MIRIHGLVKTLEWARDQLTTGLRPEEVSGFMARLREVLSRVEAICQAHGMRPDQLPGPSRRAYAALKAIRPETIPVWKGERPAPPKPTRLVVHHLVRVQEALADTLWSHTLERTDGPEWRREFASGLITRAERLKRMLDEHQSLPELLQPRTRQAYAWVQWLAEPARLDRYLTGLQRALEAIRICGAPVPLSRLRVRLMPVRFLWKRRPADRYQLLTVHLGFVEANTRVWLGIMRGAFESDPKQREKVNAFACSPGYLRVVQEIEAILRPQKVAARGYAHDLQASFDRVNHAYFNGTMPRPHLVWNRTVTAGKFGHYDARTDTVMLSISLDAPHVPAFVLDFVMYHELLHKKHGATERNGRWMVHGPAFRADEQRFARWVEAKAFLRRLAGGG